MVTRMHTELQSADISDCYTVRTQEIRTGIWTVFASFMLPSHRNMVKTLSGEIPTNSAALESLSLFVPVMVESTHL